MKRIFQIWLEHKFLIIFFLVSLHNPGFIKIPILAGIGLAIDYLFMPRKSNIGTEYSEFTIARLYYFLAAILMASNTLICWVFYSANENWNHPQFETFSQTIASLLPILEKILLINARQGVFIEHPKSLNAVLLCYLFCTLCYLILSLGWHGFIRLNVQSATIKLNEADSIKLNNAAPIYRQSFVYIVFYVTVCVYLIVLQGNFFTSLPVYFWATDSLIHFFFVPVYLQPIAFICEAGLLVRYLALRPALKSLNQTNF